MGYATRVALWNKSHQCPEFQTDYRVNASIYNHGKGRTRLVENLGTVVADAHLVIDCAPFESSYGDSVIVFHLIPTRYAGRPTIDIARGEMMSLLGQQDHFVEYYREDGCAAGVLYATGPFNHPNFSTSSLTLIQAPKYYVSSTVDSILSVVNGSPDCDYDRVAHLQLTLAGDGVRHTWTEDIPAFVPRSISVREKLEQCGVAIGASPRFVCLYGLCDNAVLVPLTIVSNLETGAIGVEHSLPPDYYSPTARGPARARIAAQLTKSSLFEVRR